MVNAPPACAPVPSGLISWWQGQSNAADDFGTNNGALEGGVSFASGEVGQAFLFDGASGSVVVPDSVSLRLTNQITIECWINTAKVAGDQHIAGKVGGSGGNNGYELGLTGGTLVGQFNSPGQYWPGQSVQAAVPVAAGVWNHVAWTYDQSAMTLYWNGAPVATKVIGSNAIAQSTSNFQIGGVDSNPNVFFNGLIDEVSVYDVALSAAQIQAIYWAADVGKCEAAPAFVAQPQGQTAQLGATVSFAALTAGAQPFSYQWAFDGTVIPSATNSFLVVSNVQFANAGAYSVVVSNAVGTTVSSDAVLTVAFPPALVRMVGGAAASGGSVSVPIVLAANGNENALGLSVNFDPTILAFDGAVLGSGAGGGSLLLSTNLLDHGELGVLLALPSGTTFASGTQEVARVTFTTAILITNSSTTLSFGDQPIKRQLSDALALALAAYYSNATVSIAAVQFEGVFLRVRTATKW